jgi:hypothetical protein
MFLYFSDWSTDTNLAKLDERGFPHSDRLIKVYASSENPSVKLGREITTVEFPSSPFFPDEEFKFRSRGTWTGSNLEEYLEHFHLPEEEKRKARALFRFANSPKMEIVQYALEARNPTTRGFICSLPLAIIDGLDEAKDRGRQNGLHLDISTQRSIDRLGKIIDLENAEGLLTIRESTELTRTTPEGSQTVYPEGYHTTKGKESL